MTMTQPLIPDGTIAVAFSGGIDSVALVKLLEKTNDLILLHVNHGEESKEDQKAIRNIALELAHPYKQLQANLRDFDSQAQLQSEQMLARRMRYTLLEKAAEDYDCVALATGHHQQDVSETVLMQILNGVHPLAITGIPEFRTTDKNLRIIRPLLNCTKQDIQELVGTQKYFQDPENLNSDYTRVRTRRVLQDFENINKDASKNLISFLNQARELQKDVMDIVPKLTFPFHRSQLPHNDLLLSAALRNLLTGEEKNTRKISRSKIQGIVRWIRNGSNGVCLLSRTHEMFMHGGFYLCRKRSK